VAGRKDEGETARLVLSGRVLDAGEELALRIAGTAAQDVPLRISGPETAVDLVMTGPANRKEASFRPERLGRYEARCTIGGVQSTAVFFVEANPLERETLKPATDELYELARATGGGLVRLPELNELPHRVLRSFPGALKEVEETPEKNPFLYIIFAAAVVLEWLLRRRLLTV
jgi:hypothetical protein